MEEQKSSLLIFALSLGLALLLYFYFGHQLNRQQVAQQQSNATKKEAPAKEPKKVELKGKPIRIETPN